MFSKKRPPTGQGANKDAANIQAAATAQIRKQKEKRIDNTKNIANGAIALTVNQNDKARAGFTIDYRDNPFDMFDQYPDRITSYIESKQRIDAPRCEAFLDKILNLELHLVFDGLTSFFSFLFCLKTK